MFSLYPPMPLRKRLALWWSVTWRQMSVSGPAALVLILIYSGIGTWWYMHHGVIPNMPEWASVAMSPILAIVTAPFIGHMTWKAFRKHDLTTPPRLTTRQANLLGWTTWGWGMLFQIPVQILLYRLEMGGHSLLTSVIEELWALAISFVVLLPRQAWRLRQLASGGASYYAKP